MTEQSPNDNKSNIFTEGYEKKKKKKKKKKKQKQKECVQGIGTIKTNEKNDMREQKISSQFEDGYDIIIKEVLPCNNKHDQVDRNGKQPFHDNKSHIFIEGHENNKMKKKKKKKKKNEYVQDVNTNIKTNEKNDTRQQQIIEGGLAIKDLPCFHTRNNLWAALGKLLRVGTMVNSTWTTSEIIKTPCRFIFPENQSKKNEGEENVYNGKDNESEGYCKDHKDSYIVVEMATNRNHISDSVGFNSELNKQYTHIPNNPNNLFHYIENYLIGYIEDVKEYGFNHIIIIEECYLGILFLDCYGRIFILDSMCKVIRLFGDYFEVVKMVEKGSRTSKYVEWVVELDGTVVECDD